MWSIVNSEILTKVLYLQNFVDAKFSENKTLGKWQIMPCRNILPSQLNMSFNTIQQTKKNACENF